MYVFCGHYKTNFCNCFFKNIILSNTPVFTSNGVSFDKPTIASCGSGITACWIALAADAAEIKEIPVFVVRFNPQSSLVPSHLSFCSSFLYLIPVSHSCTSFLYLILARHSCTSFLYLLSVPVLVVSTCTCSFVCTCTTHVQSGADVHFSYM